MLLSPHYVRAILQSGGLPVPVPMLADTEDRLRLLSMLDGIVLSGGDDYPGELFGEPTHPSSLPEDPQRVAVEPAIASWALEQDLPILAVCMGMQTLAIVLGGRLIQDISAWFAEGAAEPANAAIEHRVGDGYQPTFHDISVDPESQLARILGGEQVEVNSYHHQAIAPLETWDASTAEIDVLARSDDGIIEAISLPNKRWCLGVQWHPERLIGRPEHLALFRALVDVASA